MQPVRVQPRQGADGVRIGRGQLRKGVKQLAAQSEVCKFKCSILVVYAVHRHSGLVGLGREQRADIRLTGAHGLCRRQRTGTAHYAQPHTALVVLAGKDLDLPHLTGGAGMSAAAGADVRTRDGHDAHLSLDLLFGAVDKGGKLLPGGVADEHRHILPHDAVGGKLCLPQPLGADGHAGVHAHHLAAHMEAHILRPEHLVQNAGKDMLAGVLLHFVKPPVPVDAAGSGCAGRCGSGQGIHRMPDDTRLLVDVQHPQHRAVRQGQSAPVGGLTAALRVEHRAVQRNAPAAGLFVRLCGKDDAFAPGAKSVLLKVFFCALHRASTSCR